jgi:cytochrome P450
VEELLRYDAPVPHSTFRYATEPVEIAGVTIPAGGQVIISLASANRDDQRYPDPEVLDIDRADTRHLAFGHGIHRCLGAPLAQAEGQIGLASLLRRFPRLRLAVPVEELHWGHGDGLVLRGLSELPVTRVVRPTPMHHLRLGTAPGVRDHLPFTFTSSAARTPKAENCAGLSCAVLNAES